MSNLLKILALFLLACNNPSSNEDSAAKKSPTSSGVISDTMKELSDSIGRATDSVLAAAPDTSEVQAKTQDEIDKLTQFEYKVAENDSPAAEDLEKLLLAQGKDGYECFSVIPKTKGYIVSCKRRPKSVLNQLRVLRIP